MAPREPTLSRGVSLDRKALVREYKETPRPAGVYRVANSKNGRALVGASVDAPSTLNRHRAQLRMGGHPNRSLQADWDELGSEAFIFEVLDTLDSKDDQEHDPSADLKILEELWIAKLELPAERSY